MNSSMSNTRWLINRHKMCREKSAGELTLNWTYCLFSNLGTDANREQIKDDTKATPLHLIQLHSISMFALTRVLLSFWLVFKRTFKFMPVIISTFTNGFVVCLTELSSPPTMPPGTTWGTHTNESINQCPSPTDVHVSLSLLKLSSQIPEFLDISFGFKLIYLESLSIWCILFCLRPKNHFDNIQSGLIYYCLCSIYNMHSPSLVFCSQ